LICDNEGVPALIQSLRYRAGDMVFVAKLFDGKRLLFTSDWACPSVGLMQSEATRMQMLEAENRIEQFLLNNFKRLH
jgi:hypothetical protein